MATAPGTRNDSAAAIRFRRETLELQEALLAQVPALAEAWGDGDPVVAFLREAVAGESPALVRAAGAAVAARKIAELTGHPSIEEVADIAWGAARMPVVKGGGGVARLLELRLNRANRLHAAPPAELEELLPVLDAAGMRDALRAASLLNELLADRADEDGLHGNDDARCEGRVLVKVPCSWRAVDDGHALENPGAAEVVGVGGFHVTEYDYRDAKHKLRNLSMGKANGPRFVKWLSEEFDVHLRRKPGGELAHAMLHAVRGAGEIDVEEAFVVVEDGKVIGIGGWRERGQAAGEPPEEPSGVN